MPGGRSERYCEQRGGASLPEQRRRQLAHQSRPLPRRARRAGSGAARARARRARCECGGGVALERVASPRDPSRFSSSWRTKRRTRSWHSIRALSRRCRRCAVDRGGERRRAGRARRAIPRERGRQLDVEACRARRCARAGAATAGSSRGDDLGREVVVQLEVARRGSSRAPRRAPRRRRGAATRGPGAPRSASRAWSPRVRPARSSSSGRL